MFALRWKISPTSLLFLNHFGGAIGGAHPYLLNMDVHILISLKVGIAIIIYIYIYIAKMVRTELIIPIV